MRDEAVGGRRVNRPRQDGEEERRYKDWQERAPGSKDPRKELTRRKSPESKSGQQEEKDKLKKLTL